MSKVLVIDTSMLCCWLRVPGKETCGTTEDKWDYPRVDEKIQQELRTGSTTLVLPLATILETGNHIAQSAGGDRYNIAKGLAELMMKAADGLSPWAAFTDQSILWGTEGLKQLAEKLPMMASQSISIGDATITAVADHYAKARYHVEIFTGDAGLKAYEPTTETQQQLTQNTPRRRR
ncbi:hypothetical protein [Tumebacillus permanentifrigoris]|uniref:PIN domain-containing protein n=1 Tax=Tumebacillus permanentifrigoris TaxID=378543 RepID=A0A316DB31_9BACL|nr:hypothetical protein [Tumebacillus permanentifrigoris]PWK14815.1 hypothetical protein C7459_10412 [Tumebacillus permanentifrigoris]